MSNLLGGALAAQTVIGIVLLAFAIRAWARVRDGRLGILAIAFLLLLGQTVVLLLAAASDLFDLEQGLTFATFVGLAAFVALYLAILRP